MKPPLVTQSLTCAQVSIVSAHLQSIRAVIKSEKRDLAVDGYVNTIFLKELGNMTGEKFEQYFTSGLFFCFVLHYLAPVDVGCCYRCLYIARSLCLSVCLSCLSVGHSCNLYKNVGMGMMKCYLVDTYIVLWNHVLHGSTCRALPGKYD